MIQEDDYEVKLKKLMDSALMKGLERGSISISQCVEIENVEDAKKIIIKLLKPKKMSEEDRKHLQWIHDRLVYVYGESENVDFLIKMREIIKPKEDGNRI